MVSEVAGSDVPRGHGDAGKLGDAPWEPLVGVRVVELQVGGRGEIGTRDLSSAAELPIIHSTIRNL